MSHHPLGIVGLVLNMAGSMLLLWAPPGARGYRPDGSAVGWFSFRATPEGKRRYLLYANGFRLAVLLLVVGFFLQLLDLINTP